MPFRLNEYRAKVQFTTSAELRPLLREAAQASGARSDTHFINLVLCKAIADALGLDEATLVDGLPPHRGESGVDAKPDLPA